MQTSESINILDSYPVWVVLGVLALVVPAIVWIVSKAFRGKIRVWLNRFKIRLLRITVRLSDTLRHKHGWVLGSYLVVFAGLALGYDRLTTIGHALTYAAAALTLLMIVILWVARRVTDPVTLPPRGVHLTEPLKNNEVRRIENPDSEDFRKLVELGFEAFAAWGGGYNDRSDAYLNFFKGHSHSFYLITPNQESNPVGFTCVLPLNQDAYRSFRLGELDSWQFAATSFDQGGGDYQYLCLNAIYLQRKYRKKYPELPLKVLFRQLADFMSPQSPTQPILFAEGLTKLGCTFLKRNGFESFHTSSDGNPIFELDLARIETKSTSAQAFASRLRTALERYQVDSNAFHGNDR